MIRRAFAAALGAAFLAAAPSAAQDRLETQKRLCGDYVRAARGELALARGQLETLQELALTPHSADEPVESALLHLDLAESHLAAAQPAITAALSTGTVFDGWTPFEARLERAVVLLRRTAPELAAVYDATPIRAAPLDGKTVAQYHRRQDAVQLRGAFAVNAVSPEALAAWLAHEATHQLRRSSAPAAGFRRGEELEARRSQCRVWKALGADPKLDWADEHGSQLRALEKGDRSFEQYEVTTEETPPDWAWVKPAAAPPPAAGAPEQELFSSTEGAVMAPRLTKYLARSRGNFADAAQAHLDFAREALGDLPELMEPRPKIVTYDVMAALALQRGRYTRPLYTAFQALHPVMTELSLARAALGRGEIDDAERKLLESYAPARAAQRALPASAQAVVRRWNRRAPAVVVADVPGGSAPAPAILLPGAWQAKEGRPEIAAAWTAHVLAHRRQKLKEGELPDESQELAAIRASLDVWRRCEADEGFKDEHPDRFLRWRAAEQAGGDVLETYLRTSGIPLRPAR